MSARAGARARPAAPTARSTAAGPPSASPPSASPPSAGRPSAGAARLSRSERRAATRAALLRSASRSICERGMHGASIDRIAAAAGYTKGAFYANFASKEEMFLAMLDEKFDVELARLEAVMADADAELPPDVARRAATDFLAYVDRDPEWPRLYQEFAAHAARHEPFRAELAARMRALRARMADVLARWGAARGIAPALPHDDVASMLMLMADGFLLDRLIDPELNDRLYATMCEVLLRGLVSMAPAEAAPPTPPAAPTPTAATPSPGRARRRR